MKTFKIIGISGSGKSTLIHSLQKDIKLPHISYGDYLVRFGKGANIEWNKFLAKHDDLVLIDEHLEWGNLDLVSIYKQENTCGIIFLDLPLEEILKRRILDSSRQRSLDIHQIYLDQIKAKERAYQVTEDVNIPIISISALSLTLSVFIAKTFLGRVE